MGGLKSIGKAGKAVTKQLGKTLTSIGESPNVRGQQRVNLAQNPQFISRKQKKETNIRTGATTDLGLDSGRPTYCSDAYGLWWIALNKNSGKVTSSNPAIRKSPTLRKSFFTMFLIHGCFPHFQTSLALMKLVGRPTKSIPFSSFHMMSPKKRLLWIVSGSVLP